MYQFQHIELLPVLAVVPLLIFLFVVVTRWKKSTIKKIGDTALVNQLIKGYSANKFLAKFILSLLAISFIILGILNLQKPGTMENIERKGVDVMIALDVSKSMLAEDSKPNRLEVAKQLVNKLMNQLQNDRIGLILFAGRAYMQMPLTTDHGAARMYVQGAGPEVVKGFPRTNQFSRQELPAFLCKTDGPPDAYLRSEPLAVWSVIRTRLSE